MILYHLILQLYRNIFYENIIVISERQFLIIGIKSERNKMGHDLNVFSFIITNALL
jgi:hypothetical protein